MYRIWIEVANLKIRLKISPPFKLWVIGCGIATTLLLDRTGRPLEQNALTGEDSDFLTTVLPFVIIIADLKHGAHCSEIRRDLCRHHG